MKTISNTTEEYLIWLQVERRFAQSSINSYRSRLKCFIRDVGDIKKRGYKGRFIFVAESKKNRWDRNDAQRNFRNYRKKLGLQSNITAHTIRHSFATLLVRKGVSLGHIQVLLGHSDIQTTSRYYLGILSDDEAKKAHEKGMDMDNWL